MISRKRRQQPLPAVSTCDRHIAKALREVTPPNGDATDTSVLVRRLDEPDTAYTCGCGQPATWWLQTQAVER